MWVSEITTENLTNEMIDRLLFNEIEDDGTNVDCIIVLGSIKAYKYRIPVAAKAYLSGRSKKVMLCGGSIREFSEGPMSEAEHMRYYMLKLGVPQDSIILENNSQNTIENILYALVELQRFMWLNNVSKILLVTTAYHMRRSLHIARYLFPSHIEIHACPADDMKTRRDTWMSTDVGIKRARDEVFNIVNCIKNGVFPDFEI
ncbi:MAG: YdcF family protein [Acetatifactor sp.]|nr:YdcF family protein [Acetatifactor sp.]